MTVWNAESRLSNTAYKFVIAPPEVIASFSDRDVVLLRDSRMWRDHARLE